MTRVQPYRRLRNHLWATAYRPRPADAEVVQRIRTATEPIKTLSNDQLVRRTRELQHLVQVSGTHLLQCEIVVPAFALVAEAVRRALGLVYYDVQLYAGLVLATGAIAEMKTGEGKTVVAVLPAYLHALRGLGVHVATVNDYLAERDFAQLAPVFRILGLRVGLTRAQATSVDKRQAYQCDITYGTGYEFGFDYLRDQVALRSRPRPRPGTAFRLGLRGIVPPDCSKVQRSHAFAVIDEVDSVLLDEANTPLILSSPTTIGASQTDAYRAARATIAELVESRDFERDRAKHTVQLTTDGMESIFASAARPTRGLQRPWATYIEQALQAELLLQRDVDYVVRQGEIMIVDQSTGRIFSQRSWRDGLHQAVEVKEGLTVTAEKQSSARISRQAYFQRYEQICGMTGTASGHEAEFLQFYKLPVVIVPERIPNQRQRLPTRYFESHLQKSEAIAREVVRRHAHRQPILIGTRTIDESQRLAEQLEQAGLTFKLLNGKQDEEEASLIAAAGQPGSIVIATNMAGRGTDIRPTSKACTAGGLHVIATQRQESTRVDRQLIGRAARQGGPGSCQFFVSAEDDLLVTFAPQLAQQIRDAADSKGEAHSQWDTAISDIQRRVQQQRYQQRCELYRHEQWLNDVLHAVAEREPLSV